ncbi:MFS transporter [Minwuia sp.]|uniref:MFS transporter n=1 Tax=Minwuia sp. TaxID=2493630 RepID=UPI003A932ED2
MAGTSVRPLWLIIMAATLIVFIGMGFRGVYGLFLEPISSQMGWGREIFAMTFALQNIFWGVTQPFAGGLADKYGSGRVMALGALIYGTGILLMTQADTPMLMHLTGGIMIGIGQGLASQSIAMATVARHAPVHRRTLAMAVVTMGGSAGMLVFSPLAATVIGDYGYVFTLFMFAILVAFVIPLTIPLAGRPAQLVGSDQTFGQAIREASGHRGYWLLISGFFVCGFHVTFIGLHFPAYIADSGLDPAVGGTALAMVGLFNIGGTLAAGLLGDKYSKKYLLSFLYFARAAAILFLILTPISEVTVLVFSGMIGLLWLSTVPLTTGLVGQIFGPQFLGMLAGVVFFSHQVGSFLGAWLGGVLFESTGSYDVVWWISVGLGVLAGLVHFPINDKPVVRNAVPA